MIGISLAVLFAGNGTQTVAVSMENQYVPKLAELTGLNYLAAETAGSSLNGISRIVLGVLCDFVNPSILVVIIIDGGNMLAIVNGKVLTATGRNYDCGTILIHDGKITAVGSAEEIDVPDGAEVIDVAAKRMPPGLIGAHTHISTFGEPRSRPGYPDVNEITTPVTSHLRGIDALNPFDAAIGNVRSAGFTTCYTGPGSSNVIGGTGISFKLKETNSIYDIR